MLYALFKMNKGIKAVLKLLPKTGLLVMHAILLVLIVLTALLFYIAQFLYFISDCNDQPSTPQCIKKSNYLQTFNATYSLIDALCYILILFMTFKFLVPLEKVTFKKMP